MVLASDNFTDSNGTVLSSHTSDSGHSWTQHPSSVQTTVINSNKIAASTLPLTLSLYYSSAVPPSADYSVQADLTFVGGTFGNIRAGVAGRLDTSANTCYCAQYIGSTTNAYRLIKIVAGTTTSLGTYVITPAAGETHTIKLEMIGTTINMYVDGTLRIAATDSAITATGRAGVRPQNTNADEQLDNWSAFNSIECATYYYRRRRAA